MPELNFKDKIIKITREISQDAFYCLFVFLLITGIIEIFKPGFLLNYINLNCLLGITILLGAINILFSSPEVKTLKKFHPLNYSTIFLLSIIFGIFVIYFLREIGPWNFLAGICAIIVTYLFIILSFKENL